MGPPEVLKRLNLEFHSSFSWFSPILRTRRLLLSVSTFSSVNGGWASGASVVEVQTLKLPTDSSVSLSSKQRGEFKAAELNV